MQTPREVIDSLLRKRPAERVGLMGNPWGQTLGKWVGQGYPANDDGKPVDPVDHFGYDMAGCGGGFDWQPKMGVNEVIEETDEWVVKRNGSGAALKWWKTKAGTPEHVDFLMSSSQIWGRDYRPLLPGTAGKRVTAETIANTAKQLARRREQGLWRQFGGQFVWENMRGSMGDMTLYESMLLDPGWIHDYCRVYTDLYVECFRLLFEQAGRPDGVWLYEDLGYRDRLFCSPECLGSTVFQYYAEIVEFFHGYDLPVVLHTCGFTHPALDLIVDAGFDGLNPMEVKAGNDIFWIAENYGDQLCLFGGLDERVLESGNRALIRESVVDFIEGLKKRGARFVFASDHSLSTNVDYDDYKYALDVYHEHKMY